ncbi:MAG: hypothetical protein ACRD6N_05235 [Pyrinomonadaceae bacterium]
MSSVPVLDEAQPAIVQTGSQTKPQRKHVAFAVRRLLREPLVQFLLIGLALFVAYRVLSPVAVQPNSLRIELTKDDLSQLQVTWMAQWQRPPTADEMPDRC